MFHAPVREDTNRNHEKMVREDTNQDEGVIPHHTKSILHIKKGGSYTEPFQ